MAGTAAIAFAGVLTGSQEWPNPDNTGVPDGWVPTLTTDQLITLDTEGAILEDVRLTDGASIAVTAENVTIRRCELLGGVIDNQPGSNPCGNGLLIEDVSILPTSPGAPVNDQGGVIAFGGYTARRVKIFERSEGFRVSSVSFGCVGVTVEDSFAKIVPPTPCDDWHGDGLQGFQGASVTIRNVTIDMTTQACTGTAPFFYDSTNFGTVDIDRLLVMGQGSPFRLETGGSVVNLRIVNDSWVFFPVDVPTCNILTAWEAKLVTIDANYQVTAEISDQGCD